MSTTFRTLGALVATAIGLLLVALPGAAAAKDRNHDGIRDRWERRHDLSLRVDQARRDQDHDQLRNKQEFRAHMDPRDEDSDNDGVEDGDEGAGVIRSFNADSGELTIDIFGDGSVTGLVTDDTEIECDDGDDHGDEDGDDEGDHEGDDEGDHEGDDVGDDVGDEPGDDAGDEPGHDVLTLTEGEDGGDAGDEPGHDVLTLTEGEDGGDAGDEPGDDEGDEEGDDERDCSSSHLVPGAIVQEAELEIEAGLGLVFEEIELLVR